MTSTRSTPVSNPTPELKPQMTVIGVGCAGGAAVNTLLHRARIEGVEYLVVNTNAHVLARSLCEWRLQLGIGITQGVGAAGSPDIGQIAAEETREEISKELRGSTMALIVAGMGGGTGTGASPVIARVARRLGILTVGVVTTPFHFEGVERMRIAEKGIARLRQCTATLIVLPNQNLMRLVNKRTTFTDVYCRASTILSGTDNQVGRYGGCCDR